MFGGEPAPVFKVQPYNAGLGIAVVIKHVEMYFICIGKIINRILAEPIFQLILVLIGILRCVVRKAYYQPGRSFASVTAFAYRHEYRTFIGAFKYISRRNIIKLHNHFVCGVVPSGYSGVIDSLSLEYYMHSNIPVTILQRIVWRSFVVKHGGYCSVVLYALPIVINKVAYGVSDNGLVSAPRLLVIWPCRGFRHAKVMIMVYVKIVNYAAFAVGIAYCPTHELVLFAVLQPVAYFHVARGIAANVALFGFFGELLARVRAQHNLSHFRVARFNGQLERYAKVRC